MARWLGRVLLVAGATFLLPGPGAVRPAAQDEARRMDHASAASLYLPRVEAPRPAARWLGGLARAVAADGDMAWLGLGAGVVGLDLSDPTAPRELGRLGPLPGVPAGLALVGTRLYVAADDAGLIIADVADPARPRVLGSVPTRDQAMAVAVDGTYAYVADDRQGLLVVDVTDPARPFHVWAADGPGRSLDVALRPPFAYVANGSAGFWVADIADPTRIRFVGLANIGHVHGVALAGTHVLAVRHDLQTGLVVMDVTEPAHPQSVASLPVSMDKVTVYRSRAYGVGGPLSVVDVTDPTQPFLVHRLADAVGQAVALTGGQAVVATGPDGGLVVADVHDYARIELTSRTRLDGLGTVRLVAGSGDRLYVEDTVGLQLRDASRPSVDRLAELPVPGLVHQIAAEGAQLFVAGNGLSRVDTANPAQPVVYEEPDAGIGESLYGVAANGDRVVGLGSGLGYGCPTLRIYRAPATAPPELSGEAYPGSNGRSVALSTDGRLAAIGQNAFHCDAGFDGGHLELFDVSAPDKPRRAGGLVAPEPVLGVAFAGAYVLAAVDDHGLMVADAADPSRLRWVADVPLPGGATAVIVSGDRAYVGGEDGIRRFDVRDPAHPQLLDRHAASQTVDGFALAGGRVWAAQGGAGLLGLLDE
jgi:hypothetical protein